MEPYPLEETICKERIKKEGHLQGTNHRFAFSTTEGRKKLLGKYEKKPQQHLESRFIIYR